MLESRVIGGGQSGKDTGEITTYNTHTYTRLESLYGAEKTSRIAASQKAALDFVEDVVKQKRINCGFSRQDAFVFFDSPSVGPEFKAILNAGLHDTKEVKNANATSLDRVCQIVVASLLSCQEAGQPSQFVMMPCMGCLRHLFTVSHLALQNKLLITAQ